MIPHSLQHFSKNGTISDMTTRKGTQSMPTATTTTTMVVCAMCDCSVGPIAGVARVCPGCHSATCSLCMHEGGRVGCNPYCVSCLRCRYARVFGRGLSGDRKDSSQDDEIHDLYGVCATLEAMVEAEQ